MLSLGFDLHLLVGFQPYKDFPFTFSTLHYSYLLLLTPQLSSFLDLLFAQPKEVATLQLRLTLGQQRP